MPDTALNKKIALVVVLVLPYFSCVEVSKEGAGMKTAKYVVSNRVLHPLNDMVFGQFMERAGKGEPGPEAAMLPDGKLRPDVKALIKEMAPPVMRFPGGGQVETIKDWTILIDNAPGRDGGRKAGDSFGYDEFLRLAEDIPSQTILCVNLRMAVWKEVSLDEAVRRIAGLVAYCNAKEGTKLPDGMPDWPAIRAKNGHPQPYGVKYFQIGNEGNVYYPAMGKISGIKDPQEQIKWWKECVLAYAKAIRGMDPSVKIIVDGVIWDSKMAGLVEAVLADENIHKAADLMAFHIYRPGGTKTIKKDGKEVKQGDLREEEIWNACVSVPNIGDDGVSYIPGGSGEHGKAIGFARKYGWPIAMTEWNWNGWGQKDRIFNSLFARAVGAAGFLNGMIRLDVDLQLATQSMFIGSNWPIAAIFVKADSQSPAQMHPTGQMTAFYQKYHGSRVMDVKSENPGFFAQPVQINEIEPSARVAVLDAVATASDSALFFHVINRDFKEARKFTLTLYGIQAAGEAVQRTMEGPLDNDETDVKCGVRIVEKKRDLKGNVLDVEVPPRSVSIFEIPLKSVPAGDKNS